MCPQPDCLVDTGFPWRVVNGGKAGQRTGYSSRGPGSDSQSPLGVSQPSVTPIPDLTHSSGLCESNMAYMLEKHIYT